MKKKKIDSVILITLIVIASVALLVAIVICITSIAEGLIGSQYIFADIEECYNLDKHEKDAKFEQYESPNRDKCLKNLSYAKFFAGKYVSKDLQFEIFAYEFESEEEAKLYYAEATGGSYLEKDFSASMYAGLVYGELKAYNGKNAYTLNYKTIQIKKLQQVISNTFSISIDALIEKERETGAVS